MPNTVQTGQYVGDLILKAEPDGVIMSLVQPYAYIDSKGLKWSVPAKTKVDGASIPRVLWSLAGAPLTGRYRNASVIHDWFCDRRTREWQAVHRVFFEAMVTSRVSRARAELMYAAVYAWGPRWNTVTVANNNLADRDLTALGAGHKALDIDALDLGKPVRKPAKTTTVYKLPEDQAAFDRLAKQIGTKPLGLDDIEALVDRETADLSPRTISKTVSP